MRSLRRKYKNCARIAEQHFRIKVFCLVKIRELFIMRCATLDSQTTILMLQRATKLALD